MGKSEGGDASHSVNAQEREEEWRTFISRLLMCLIKLLNLPLHDQVSYFGVNKCAVRIRNLPGSACLQCQQCPETTSMGQMGDSKDRTHILCSYVYISTTGTKQEVGVDNFGREDLPCSCFKATFLIILAQ